MRYKSLTYMLSCLSYVPLLYSKEQKVPFELGVFVYSNCHGTKQNKHKNTNNLRSTQYYKNILLSMFSATRKCTVYSRSFIHKK